MRPDRVVVGEVRGGEALDMVQAMLSGHAGSLSTIHANSPRDALVRLETLSLMSDVDIPIYVARAQVASAIHLVLQLTRFSEDGSRKLTRVSEVMGLDSKDQYRVQDLFEIQMCGKTSDGRLKGSLEPTGQLPTFAEEPYRHGLEERIVDSKRLWRRGAATLDYVLVLGIVLPLIAFVLRVAPRIMNLVYEMTSVLVSWPFL
jgi:pilus assembly protein CpaF